MTIDDQAEDDRQHAALAAAHPLQPDAAYSPSESAISSGGGRRDARPPRRPRVVGSVPRHRRPRSSRSGDANAQPSAPSGRRRAAGSGVRPARRARGHQLDRRLRSNSDGRPLPRPAGRGTARRSGRRPGTRRSGCARSPARRCPRSASRSIRSSTSAVWATPSAAVGSSMITSLASSITALATATACRWPPDSEPTGWRIERTVVTARSLQRLLGGLLHGRPRRAAGAARASWPRNMFCTMSRLSHSARSW